MEIDFKGKRALVTGAAQGEHSRTCTLPLTLLHSLRYRSRNRREVGKMWRHRRRPGPLLGLTRYPHDRLDPILTPSRF
jgi:hypothetical protein